MKFGTYLRKRRQIEGMTIRQLASHASISSTKLFRFETGESQPDLLELKRIAGVFSENVTQFLIVQSKFSEWRKQRAFELKQVTAVCSVLYLRDWLAPGSGFSREEKSG